MARPKYSVSRRLRWAATWLNTSYSLPLTCRLQNEAPKKVITAITKNYGKQADGKGDSKVTPTPTKERWLTCCPSGLQVMSQGVSQALNITCACAESDLCMYANQTTTTTKTGPQAILATKTLSFTLCLQVMSHGVSQAPQHHFCPESDLCRYANQTQMEKKKKDPTQS